MHLGICLCPSPQGRPAMPGDETEGEHTKGGSPPTGRCFPPRAHCTYCTHTAAHLLDRHTTDTITKERHCTYCTHILPRIYSRTILLSMLYYGTIKREREGRNCSYDN